MSTLLKKIIALLVLVSFMVIIFFGFAIMLHGPDGQMQGNCPFSAPGVSLCPQDTLAVALHHISSYHSFLNVPINFNIAAFIISLLFADYSFLQHTIVNDWKVVVSVDEKIWS